MFSPPPRVKRSRHASRHIRDARAVMHAGITNWWFPLKSVAGKSFPAFPAHTQPAILRICLTDSHPQFVYVVILSISLFSRIRETNPLTKTSKILFSIVIPTFGKSCRRPWLRSLKKQSLLVLSLILKQIFQDGGHRTCMQTLGGKHTRKSVSFWYIGETCSIFLYQVF